MQDQISYETLRAVALLVREGHTGNATPTPHQARDFARGIVVLCDEVDDLRAKLKAACIKIDRLRETLKRQAVAHHAEVQEQVAAERERRAKQSPLTRERIWSMAEMCGWFPHDHYRLEAIVRGVERAHGITSQSGDSDEAADEIECCNAAEWARQKETAARPFTPDELVRMNEAGRAPMRIQA